MVSAVMDFSVTVGGDVQKGRVTATGDGGIFDDIALTANQSNKEITLDFKETDLVAGALAFFADQAVTIKTNSSSDPDDTFHVAAGGFVNVPALTADITSIFATNGNATTAATLTIRGARDVTP